MPAVQLPQVWSISGASMPHMRQRMPSSSIVSPSMTRCATAGIASLATSNAAITEARDGIAQCPGTAVGRGTPKGFCHQKKAHDAAMAIPIASSTIPDHPHFGVEKIIRGGGISFGRPRCT